MAEIKDNLSSEEIRVFCDGLMDLMEVSVRISDAHNEAIQAIADEVEGMVRALRLVAGSDTPGAGE